MRVLFVVALLLFGIAGVTAAGASDLAVGHPGRYSARDFEHGQRSAMLWIYDYQPGVIVRDYWRAPWRHQHYFPATGKRPRIGRKEDLSATGKAPRPAQTFRRSWSNASAFEHEPPRADVLPRTDALPLDTQPAPHAKRSHKIRPR
jgi:hypothetical protein